MKELFDTNGQRLDLNQLELLSDKGSECIVYKYNNNVVKLFRENYNFSHLTMEEIFFLKNIPTKRILFPTDVIFDENENMVGYQMSLIVGEKDIQSDRMGHVLDEMRALQYDLSLLSKFRIGLRDINLCNTIYNGRVYLIDPGNYVVNGLSAIKRQMDPLNEVHDEKVLLQNWNFNKINQLFDSLLFSKNASVDPYQFRLIVQFFIKEREVKKTNFNLRIFQEYFNQELSVHDATKQFMRKYIKEDKKEREWYLSGRERQV